MSEHQHDHHEHDHDHGHQTAALDAALATDRGIWAVKVSLVALLVTAIFQIFIVAISGSVALLADTIHNFSDALTAIPLGLAFTLSRRARNTRFTYGYGRAEDIAGVIIVLMILFSAIEAIYQSVLKIINPQPITNIGWVTVAAIIGFLGNELVAIFRIRVGRQMGSAALVADGYHARTDGFTSLADGMWSMKSRQNVGWNDVREYREDPYGVYLHKVDAYVSFPALTGEEIIDLYHALPEEEGYILGEWAYRITVGPRGGVRAVKA